MELEVLGGRMLTPYFGSKLQVVMGSVIGVFLLSLSVGYMLGGWVSGRPNSKTLLGIGLMVAGAWTCLTPFINEPVCDRLFDLIPSDEWGSLVAAAVLFSLPTLLLGTVTPTAVRWLTTEASASGVNAGLVLALSTVASFAGCVVTAFYLVDVSIRRTLGVSGVLLLLLGAAVVLHARLHRGSRRAEVEE